MSVRSLCELLGIDVPILQAPTGSIAGPELAAAVSTAGGLGAMGMTWADADQAAGHVGAVRAATSRPFLVNYVLAFPPRSLDAALEAGAPVVSFSFGDADPVARRVRAAGALLGVQVTCGEGARRATDMGASFLICQGTEAGGHVQATRDLGETLEEVLGAAGDTPVVAAGGIATGERCAELISLGASGVMMGSRFVAALESRAHDRYKSLLCDAGAGGTALTVCFDGGWPQAAHRVLRSSTLRAWEAAGSPARGSRPGEGETVARSGDGQAILRYDDTAPRFGMTGSIEEMCLYAGTGAGAIERVEPAGELLRRLWRECQDALSQQGSPT